MEPKRIVFLSAKSGGGHDGAARALSALIEARYPGRFQFDILDIYNAKADRALPLLAQIRHHSDVIWQLFLWLTNHRFFVSSARWFMQPYMLRQIRRQLPDQPIAVLVAVHFNPAQWVNALADSLTGRPRTVIVATDYDPHWSWIGQADAIVVASEGGKLKAQQVGYLPAQLLQLPVLPNEQAVNAQGGTAIVRESATRKRVLMVSGQDGSNQKKILALLRGIAALPVATQMTLDVYCGKNAALKQAIEQLAPALGSLELRAHGFVPGLHLKIAAADLMLMRASPQILSECISAGVPVLAFDWSVHEQYQAVLINRENLGVASKQENVILQHLQRMISIKQEYQRYEAGVQSLARGFDAEQLLAHVLPGVAGV